MIDTRGSPSRQASTTVTTPKTIARAIANQPEYFSMKSPSLPSSDATSQTLGLVGNEPQDAAQMLKFILQHLRLLGVASAHDP